MTSQGKKLPDSEEFKSCCSNFYADDVVRRILGDSFHPGGEKLTEDLLNMVNACEADRVLDVAAGQGTSSILAAQKFGCHVTALDLSAENLGRAKRRAGELGVGHLIETRVSDAEHIPFDDASFDIVLCECAFCVFPDKTRAAAEMFRVLKPGGRLALSDMTISTGELPEDLDTLLMRVACIADAVTPKRLMELFEAAGFSSLRLGDASWGLVEMVEGIRGRLLAVELASKIGKLDLGGMDIEEGKRMAVSATEAIGKGVVSYDTLTGVADKGAGS